MAIIDQFYKRLKALYAKEKGVFPEPIVNLAWEYGAGHEPEPHLVAKEINGYFTRDMTITDKDKILEFKKGDQVPMFKYLQDDGSTVSGCWIYCGSYTEEGNRWPAAMPADLPTGMGMSPEVGLVLAGEPADHLQPRLGQSGQGQPFNPHRPVIAWNALEKKWQGDVPDGRAPPMTDDKEGKYPFIMVPEGDGRLYALDHEGRTLSGALRTDRKPGEEPAFTRCRTIRRCGSRRNISSDLARVSRIIGTTYRVTEHWQAGAMTSNLPWLVELVPDMFVELSEIAGPAERDQATATGCAITTERGSIEATALVTARLKPFIVEGKMIEQVGMPWHFGYAGLATGDSCERAHRRGPEPQHQHPRVQGVSLQYRRREKNGMSEAHNDYSTNRTFLIDLTRCTGCRGCQVACKQWNQLKAEKTTFFSGEGYQNPPALSEQT